jgi:hypothetical protein
MAFLIGGANSAADTGYDIDNSIRIDDGGPAYLTRTFGADGDSNKFTVSFWVKVSSVTSERMAIFSGGPEGTGYRGSYIWIDDKLTIREYVDEDVGTANLSLISKAILRDSSAWYHCVVAMDTTQAVAYNRAKVYINGTILAAGDFDTSEYTYMDQNYDFLQMNKGQLHRVARYNNSYTYPFNGYLADFYFIDGTQYAASDFGKTDEDSGIWKPKSASVTFGTNGFKLEFKGTGTSQDSSGIGADTSGEDNHFAVTNLAATDQSTDTPTNNFCTLNPLMNTAQASYSEGNLDEACNDNYGVGGSMAVANGIWYWEVKILAGDNNLVGIANGDEVWRFPVTFGINNYSVSVYGVNGKIYKEGVVVEDVADTYGADDIIGIRLDLDSGTRTIAFYKNDSAFGSAVELPSWGIATPMIRKGGSSHTSSFNFGSPSFAISSGNADANGYGNFEYAVPSSHYALCTKNLAEYG